jgi:hypothetical protein
MGKVEKEHNEEKIIEVIEKMDFETCIAFLKECEYAVIDDIRDKVKDMVLALIEVDQYPNGYSDFIKEVKANDFTMTHEKEGK